VIERQVRHAARLIDDLLDVARITHGTIELRKEPVTLAAVVAHAVETVRPVIDSRRLQLTVAFPAEPLYLEADASRLEQVLANLLDNAAKFTEPGGRIGLTAEQEPLAAVLRVWDTGIGMTQEMLARAFDLFTQAEQLPNRCHGGLGIGLTMVRQLVEMHGGQVSAHSAGLGLGSEFVVCLPTLDKRPEAPQALLGAPSPTQRKARILVVDDNRDAAESFALMLSMVGHTVQVAFSGSEALAAARAQRSEVVLLDIGLPGLDGYQVACQLRQVQGMEKAKIIAVTGYCADEDRRRSQVAGFDHHLAKPVEPAVLLELLARPETTDEL
jgi:CheY-like chemotaxis protein